MKHTADQTSAPYWRLMLHPGLPGYRQMAIDEALFSALLPGSPPVLRFYSWQNPTLSLGFFQNYKRVVSEAFCMHNKIDVVRRPTGGRAVLHHYEVTYSIVSCFEGAFENGSLQEIYQLIAKALNLALLEMGIGEASICLEEQGALRRGSPQCFVTVSRFELSRNARKIIGSAQKRGRDRFLQHGSILVDFDSRLQQGCVRNPDPDLEQKIATLNELSGRPLAFEEIAGKFGSAFERTFGVRLTVSDLNQREIHVLESLEQKHSSQAWIREACK